MKEDKEASPVSVMKEHKLHHFTETRFEVKICTGRLIQSDNLCAREENVTYEETVETQELHCI